MTLSIRLAERTDGFEVADGIVRWTGPTDPEDGAPLVEWELHAEPFVLDDPQAIAPLVARYPMPASMLDDLARRCIARDANASVTVLQHACDARWSRALAAALLAAGLYPARKLESDPGTIVTTEIPWAMRVTPDGTLVRLESYQKFLTAGDRTIPLTTVSRLGPEDCLELCDGTSTPAIAPPGRTYGLPRVHISNGWLLTFIGASLLNAGRADEIVWTHLERGDSVTHAWGREIKTLVTHAGIVWCTTNDGLWRLVGGEPPVRVRAGAAWGLAVAEGVAWLGSESPSGRAIVAVDLANGVETSRVAVPLVPFRIWTGAGGVVASDMTCAAFIAGRKIVATTESRRDVAVAMLADGTLAASSGEQVGILEPAGTFRWAEPMPYDGCVCCATRDRFIFGPVNGGEAHVRPDALIAFDRDGCIRARLPGEFFNSTVATSDHVYATTANGVLRWDPSGPTEGITITAPPPRRATERHATSFRTEITNPRDERPEVGIEIRHSNALVLDGKYGGTTGRYGEEVAFRVGDAAIVTFVDCEIAVGAAGDSVQRGATVFAIQCVLPSPNCTLGRDCHFVAIDCDRGSFIASGRGAKLDGA